MIATNCYVHFLIAYTAPTRLSQLSLPAYGSQEFDVETSSTQSGPGQDMDGISLGSRTSDSTPKSAVALYNYTVRDDRP